MRRKISIPVLAILVASAAVPSFAFNQPPLNLGLTDILDGRSQADTKEQVFAIGPAVSFAASPNFFLGLKTQWESSAENRPEGNRTTFRLTYKF